MSQLPFLYNINLTFWIHHFFLVYSSTSGHLAGFHTFVIVNVNTRGFYWKKTWKDWHKIYRHWIWTQFPLVSPTIFLRAQLTLVSGARYSLHSFAPHCSPVPRYVRDLDGCYSEPTPTGTTRGSRKLSKILVNSSSGAGEKTLWPILLPGGSAAEEARAVREMSCWSHSKHFYICLDILHVSP